MNRDRTNQLRRLCAGIAAVAFALTLNPAMAQEKAAESKGGPKIQVDSPKFDFKEAWAGESIKHTFIVRNTGDAVLKITRVKPSCGCTVADFDKVIPPGGSGKVAVTVNTKKLRSQVTKTVTIESNDASNPQYRVTMAGKVKQRFKIDPPRGAAFGRIRPDEQLNRTLTLTNNMDSPVKLSLPVSKTGLFTATLDEKEAGKVYELSITAKPPYAEKINRGSFTLKTDLPGNTPVEIAVSTFVPPLVEVTPPQVIVPKAQAQARQQSVRVKFNSAEPRKILSATTTVPNGQVEIKEIAPSHYDIVLGLPANYSPPAAGHTVTLKTDDAKNPTVTVKVAQRAAPKRQTPQKPAQQLQGKPTPDATFALAQGGEFKTSEAKDDATLVMFYASWCGFCKRSLPKLDGYAKEFAGKSAKIIAVSMDSIKEDGATGKRARSMKQVTDQWKDLGVSLPQALDSNKHGGSKFKVSSFPTLFLLGKSGKVERVYVGGGAVSDGSLKKDMETLMAGKALPKQEIAAAPAKPKRPALTMAGKPIPSATFTVAADDSTFNIHDGGDAEATVAFFYASWCGYCKKALPKLSEMATSYAGKPVRFVGVNQDTIVETLDPKNRRGRTKDQVTDQWADFKVKFPQILDPNGLGRSQFKVSSFPTMFLIDHKTGKIDKAYVGGTVVNNGQLAKDINAIIGGAS